MAVDLGISLFASAGVLLFLALLSTTLRCYARIWMTKAFGLDDWLMLLTVALFAHYCTWVFYGRSLDQGRPENEIPLTDIPPALKAFYFAENSYILVTMTLKLSIGAFLLRIVKSRLQIWIIYIVLAIVTSFCTTFFLMAVFRCRPVYHFWEPFTTTGTCLPPVVVLSMNYTHSAVIAFSDFAFAILPIFVVWHLQMDRFTKISVCGLMGFGAVAGVTTIARIPFIKSLTSTANFFHATAELAILSAVEPGIGIIIGSAAATRPLFRPIFVKYGHYILYGSNNSSSSNSRSFSRNHNKSPFSSSTSTSNNGFSISKPMAAKHPRHSMAMNRRGRDVEVGNPLSEFRFDDGISGNKNGNGKGFSTVMLVEGGGGKEHDDLCWKCVEEEDRRRVCKGCGDPLCGDKTTVLRVGSRGRDGTSDKWEEDGDDVGLVDGRRRGGADRRRDGGKGAVGQDKNKIYKNVSVKRVVEFLTEE